VAEDFVAFEGKMDDVTTGDKHFDACNFLLNAALEFWNACRQAKQYGAVQWLTGANGELLIYTRGEYRDQLMANIHVFGDTEEKLFTTPATPSGEAMGRCITSQYSSRVCEKGTHGCYINHVATPQATQPEAAPSLTPLDYRAQGREEALAVILALDAETQFDDFVSSSALGDSGDYTTHWDEDALRELLNIGDRTHDAFGRAEAAYWEALGHKDEANREMLLVEQAPFYKPLSEFLSNHKAWDLLADLKSVAPAPVVAEGEALPQKMPDAVEAALMAELYTGGLTRGEGPNRLYQAMRGALKTAQAKPAEPHWIDSPQDALGGKSAREGYAEHPDYAQAKQPDLEALREKILALRPKLPSYRTMAHMSDYRDGYEEARTAAANLVAASLKEAK
jgi:hypothetical protein